MSRMLASVNNLEEALIALQLDVDIIDLKQPELGALGALQTPQVQIIVEQIQRAKPVSATIGDLPMQAELIFNAVSNMADTGVDYIKIGFFPGQDWTKVITKLATLTQTRIKLIAVLFADQQPDLNNIEQFSQAGFSGIMLDTMNKASGSLTQVMPLATLQHFVHTAHQQQLLCGLAGSLRASDIQILLPLQADYLGFRGALCEQHQRTAKLDPAAILKIKASIAAV
ncbi:(5-formylfuran-3-yl)methyl phosphate synthase [Bathymodiolus japonicus methanotrophic gill symbiont]|uniref:(5-formylfuran-3-yl)methyl phosphate synthase n=1 Tax=Bathymodiolus japonicus methanotrophic gill symbiont TaxID=113269 RepID=UPI001B708972|nr:(5-formylfuran-3-yl)methyl phosphate synthase [Bathymodiolus japonicus methanotrophic gill symbiont]GFO70997.1 (5-formylfuran-3-yl)methyl phosphate synthase [Bathymodiolus japonicus methanotrophic gill symbiont]